MKTKLWDIYQSLKARGLPPEQEEKILGEIHASEQLSHPDQVIPEPPRLLIPHPHSPPSLPSASLPLSLGLY